MATRNRITVTNHVNQENIKNVKPSITAVPGKTKRAVLGEISNKVNTMRGVEPIDRTSLLQKEKKKVVISHRQIARPAKNLAGKPPVQVVKPVVKSVSSNTDKNSNTTTTATTTTATTTATTTTTTTTTTTIVLSSAAASQKKEGRKSFSTDLLFEDIDEQDKGNPVLVSLYTNDIHEYLRSLEYMFPIKKGYLVGQEITSKMRSVLVDWLVEVHQQFRLMQETLYLTVAIIDRFLQSYKTIDRKRLQLVGVTAMFIASKYEEMYSPDIGDFVYITDQTYTKSDILQMEMLIVKTLDYSFGRPLPLHFLRRYSKAGKALPIHHTIAKYFLEQSLVNYEACHYPPSLIAAAAIYLALLIIGNDEEDEGKVVWTNTLAHYTTYSKNDILPAAQDIATIITNAEKSKYQAVRKKYVHVKYMKVSVRPELKSPTLLALTATSKDT